MYKLLLLENEEVIFESENLETKNEVYKSLEENHIPKLSYQVLLNDEDITEQFMRETGV